MQSGPFLYFTNIAIDPFYTNINIYTRNNYIAEFNDIWYLSKLSFQEITSKNDAPGHSIVIWLALLNLTTMF